MQLRVGHNSHWRRINEAISSDAVTQSVLPGYSSSHRAKRPLGDMIVKNQYFHTPAVVPTEHECFSGKYVISYQLGELRSP